MQKSDINELMRSTIGKLESEEFDASIVMHKKPVLDLTYSPNNKKNEEECSENLFGGRVSKVLINRYDKSSAR